MVPAVFKDRAGAAGPVVIVVAVDEVRFWATAEERQETFHRLRRNHQAEHIAALFNVGGDPLEVVFGDWGFEDCGELNQDAVFIGELFGKAGGVHEVVEGDEHLGPVVGGCERHLELGDDAIGAVSVRNAGELFATKF